MELKVAAKTASTMDFGEGFPYCLGVGVVYGVSVYENVSNVTDICVSVNNVSDTVYSRL